MTKEEPLIRQLVRTRALNSRDGSLSPTRRGQPSRSMSQPPRPRPDPTPVFTPLYILPYSLVYPPGAPTAPVAKTPKVSFCSVSQPDLTKLVCTSVTTSSLCSTPLSMNLSRCGSPAPPTLPSPFSTPPATPPLLSNQNWSLFASSQDLNINTGAGANIGAGANTGAGVFASPMSYQDLNINSGAGANTGAGVFASPLPYQDLNNNSDHAGAPNGNVGAPPLQQVCRCSKVQKDTCFSSLCCEICKLFPEKVDNYAAMQHQQKATNHVVSAPPKVENEQISR